MGVDLKKTGHKTKLAKKLRRDMTDAEKRLWSILRSKQFLGLKFRRQHPVGPFIVDFVCLEKNLIIEIDGGQHAIDVESDKTREEWLANEGFIVLRYWNNEVLVETSNVLDDIQRKIMDHPPPTPPLKGGG